MEREMDSTTSNTAAQSVPQLCRGNCGFYGAPSLDNYCSKCAKEHMKNTQDSLAAVLPAPTTSTAVVDQPEQAAESSIPTAQVHEVLAVVEPVIIAPLAVSTSSSAATITEETPSIDETASPKPKLKANRCHSCKRKVGLTGFDCRCGGKFCSDHRYSDAHSCQFDYKQLGQQEVRKNNPAVVCAKIEKI